VNGVGIVTVPVKVGDASGAYAVEVYALVPSVPPVPMLSVEPSVPEKVNELVTASALPEVTASARYADDQLAAVVGVATSAVKVPDVPAAKTVIVFAPDDWTVTAPVLWLTI